MPMYVLSRNFCLATTSGRSFEFRKGVPLHVPQHLVRDVVAIGGQPADGSEPDVFDEKVLPPAPTDPSERANDISEAILRLAERNQRGDFTSANLPHTKAVSTLVGYRVDAREILAVMNLINTAAAEEADQLKRDVAAEADKVA